MEEFLGKVTQHAMNYAIRSGIGITASFAISQASRLLKTVNDRADYDELHSLQDRLDSKIRIISPAIDLIELISARGNTSLESAVTLTKRLRWDIQSLGVRLEKAASAEEKNRIKNDGVKPHVAHEAEIRKIVQDIKRLLVRIEDAVPLINLAITTSGASLSTTLPPSVSPSRLLQASTFLTAGDTQYFMNPGCPVQIGPTFTLSLYMLFAGHLNKSNYDEDSARDATWKEVIHKAIVKLMRSPIYWPNENAYKLNARREPNLDTPNKHPYEPPLIAGDGQQDEYSYHLEIIEDFDDDRLHSIEDSESQPGPYGGVESAGIRESFPIFQIGKIFYADTGKILNIGGAVEANSPVLLLKRDINAQPPRKMMQQSDTCHQLYKDLEEQIESEEECDPQDIINNQLHRESSIHQPEDVHEPAPPEETNWRLPADLDPEWLAFEVYTEENELESEDERESNNDFTYSPNPLSFSGEDITPPSLTEGISNLNIAPNYSSSSSPSSSKQLSPLKQRLNPDLSQGAQPSPFGPIRSSLSLLEMLIRLTSLQQFQQASHLSIPDELLTFFLEESSTTGAGGNDEERKRTRREARRKVGFDPYDESPIKRHGEDYQRNYGNQERYSQGSASGDFESPHDLSAWPRDSSPEPWLLRNREMSPNSKKNTSEFAPSSPLSPYILRRKAFGLERLHGDRISPFRASPLGQGLTNDTDSSLGTSPGSPNLLSKFKKT